ncbi:MAG: flap endonuclease-1 [Desulfurococcales archaeon]|nr:flap endonuclease-1 [Desulfurococcales archaeon]
MGVNIRELIPQEAVRVVSDLRELRGRIIAIDAYNALYQFLTAIRQPDGTPLMDSKGRVTSHLSGLFYRTINFVEAGVKPVYVFDGKPPELKARELSERTAVREEARRKYEEAVAAGDIEAARRYAQMASRLTTEMVEDAKKLLSAMGVPWVQAPSEGEAQAAYMALRGDVWATASQDYDSLLFGAPRLVRNMTISGRRKLPRKNIYVEIKPEVIELEKVLKLLGISREQLIDIAILLGTDYNPEGVKGVGPKTALKLIRTHGNIEKALKALPTARFPVPPGEIKKLFLKPGVTDSYKLEWSEPEGSEVVGILVKEHDFSVERVKSALERLRKAYREHIKGGVRGLDAWFKRR